MTVGNEGAGTVVAGGESPLAQSLIGRTVSAAGGSMYSQFRVLDAATCLVLPEGTPARAGASSFVNPLTALGMVETMRREGHTGLVHTAAASNLEQMLVKLCVEERVPLVNIVRKTEHEDMLRECGATHVCNSSSPSFPFMDQLIAAAKETGATLAFDAIGGGGLRRPDTHSHGGGCKRPYDPVFAVYGSSTRKQAYIYGGLDPSPTVIARNFGFSWTVGGWLPHSLLAKCRTRSIPRAAISRGRGINHNVREQLQRRGVAGGCSRA